jgi:hypothetical protein
MTTPPVYLGGRAQGEREPPSIKNINSLLDALKVVRFCAAPFPRFSAQWFAQWFNNNNSRSSSVCVERCPPRVHAFHLHCAQENQHSSHDGPSSPFRSTPVTALLILPHTTTAYYQIVKGSPNVLEECVVCPRIYTKIYQCQYILQADRTGDDVRKCVCTNGCSGRPDCLRTA